MSIKWSRFLNIPVAVILLCIVILPSCGQKKIANTTSKAANTSTTMKSAATVTKTSALATPAQTAAAATADTSGNSQQSDGSGGSFYEPAPEVPDIIKGPTGDYIEGQPAYDDENIDLKGRSIKIFVGTTNLIPYAAPHNGTMISEKLSNVLAARISILEAKYNCKISYENRATGAQYAPTLAQYMVAGLYFGDIVQPNTNTVAVWSKNSFIAPIEEYVNINSKVFDDARARLGNWNKHWYGLREQIMTPRATITYNREIFDRDGIKYPYDYYKDGQWTWNA
ncbi:MAG TPA: hypothetical protein DD727_02880, partial [Clostridiales bacterium]|nr:hypothetical protein [Clostridiales bacterium]